MQFVSCRPRRPGIDPDVFQMRRQPQEQTHRTENRSAGYRPRTLSLLSIPAHALRLIKPGRGGPPCMPGTPTVTGAVHEEVSRHLYGYAGVAREVAGP